MKYRCHRSLAGSWGLGFSTRASLSGGAWPCVGVGNLIDGGSSSGVVCPKIGQTESASLPESRSISISKASGYRICAPIITTDTHNGALMDAFDGLSFPRIGAGGRAR